MDMHKSSNLDQLKWDDLRFFLEVARTRTATGAARRLGVDYTTVSRRVRALEQAGSGLGAGGADDAPAGARCDRRHQPPFRRVGIDQQQGSDRLVAQGSLLVRASL